MKGSAEYARRLNTLLRKIRTAHAGDPYEADDPIGQLIYAFLHWNVPRRAADVAMSRITQQSVDYNDLRVSHAHEIVLLLGERYPAGHERVTRMRETLHEIFNGQHTLSLDKLAGKPKKEIRHYLDRLPGMAPFVAAHVSLIVFSGHAVPVDDRLGDLLREEAVVNPDLSLAQMTGFLERNVRADDSTETHAALTAWADAGANRVSLARTTKSATRAGKSTTKKRTSKSSS